LRAAPIVTLRKSAYPQTLVKSFNRIWEDSMSFLKRIIAALLYDDPTPGLYSGLVVGDVYQRGGPRN
jgi:hypothetical protein